MRLQRRRFTEPSDVRTMPRGRIDVVELDGLIRFENLNMSVGVDELGVTRYDFLP